MTSLLATDRSTSLETIGIIMDLFIAHLNGENLAGRFDINTLSEDFFCVILNTTYGLKLVNLNKTGQMNFKDIDLGDVDSGVSYQITSENTKAKVKKHAEGFEADKKYKTYSKLHFLILSRTRHQNIPEVIITTNDFKFDGGKDVICMKDLQNSIELLDNPSVDSLLEYLNREIPLMKLLVEENVDEEIVEVVNSIVENADGTAPSSGFDYLEIDEKIKLNFESDEDREYMSSEYQRCLSRFKTIEDIINQGGSDQEIVLQSSMVDLYNKLKQDKNKSNRDIFNQMIEQIEQAVQTPKRQAARRLAIKSLIMFHFEDCTIFEKTAKEKERLMAK